MGATQINRKWYHNFSGQKVCASGLEFRDSLFLSQPITTAVLPFNATRDWSSTTAAAARISCIVLMLNTVFLVQPWVSNEVFWDSDWDGHQRFLNRDANTVRRTFIYNRMQIQVFN